MAIRYWSEQEAIDVCKDRARAKMGHEQSKRDCARERRRKQRDTASEESKAKEKESVRQIEDKATYTGGV